MTVVIDLKQEHFERDTVTQSGIYFQITTFLKQSEYILKNKMLATRF